MGRPPGNHKPVIDRLMAKVDFTSTGCWLWKGALSRKGYGHISAPGRRGGTLQVHVVVYEFFFGPVPDGLEIDHLCRVRNCVRPSHLEAVTHVVNLRRRKRPSEARNENAHA